MIYYSENVGMDYVIIAVIANMLKWQCVGGGSGLIKAPDAACQLVGISNQLKNNFLRSYKGVKCEASASGRFSYHPLYRRRGGMD